MPTKSLYAAGYDDELPSSHPLKLPAPALDAAVLQVREKPASLLAVQLTIDHGFKFCRCGQGPTSFRR